MDAFSLVTESNPTQPTLHLTEISFIRFLQHNSKTIPLLHYFPLGEFHVL